MFRAAQGGTYLGDELREVAFDHGHHDKHAGRSRSPPGEAMKIEIEQNGRARRDASGRPKE